MEESAHLVTPINLAPSCHWRSPWRASRSQGPAAIFCRRLVIRFQPKHRISSQAQMCRTTWPCPRCFSQSRAARLVMPPRHGTIWSRTCMRTESCKTIPTKVASPALAIWSKCSAKRRSRAFKIRDRSRSLAARSTLTAVVQISKALPILRTLCRLSHWWPRRPTLCRRTSKTWSRWMWLEWTTIDSRSQGQSTLAASRVESPIRTILKTCKPKMESSAIKTIRRLSWRMGQALVSSHLQMLHQALPLFTTRSRRWIRRTSSTTWWS